MILENETRGHAFLPRSRHSSVIPKLFRVAPPLTPVHTPHGAGSGAMAPWGTELQTRVRGTRLGPGVGLGAELQPGRSQGLRLGAGLLREPGQRLEAVPQQRWEWTGAGWCAFPAHYGGWLGTHNTLQTFLHTPLGGTTHSLGTSGIALKDKIEYT